MHKIWFKLQIWLIFVRILYFSNFYVRSHTNYLAMFPILGHFEVQTVLERLAELQKIIVFSTYFDDFEALLAWQVLEIAQVKLPF